jgi:hypothetical protein
LAHPVLVFVNPIEHFIGEKRSATVETATHRARHDLCAMVAGMRVRVSDVARHLFDGSTVIIFPSHVTPRG